MAKVDIIIPVYNAESTIADCLRSVMNQTIAIDCRTIVVDDGSTDSTPDLIQEFLMSYPQFAERCEIITFCRNRGAAEAYNAGLSAGRSEWIARCDADDILVPDAVERLLILGEKNGADIVAGSIEEWDGSRKRTLHPTISKGLNKTPIDTVNFSLCNKLVRRTLLLRAPDGKPLSDLPGINCWEDLSLTARLLALPGCRVETLGGEPIYCYRRTGKSAGLSRRSREYLLEQHLRCALELTEWFEANGLSAIYSPFIDRLKFKAKIKILQGKGAFGRIKEWREIFPETSASIMKMSPDMSLPLRVAFSLLAK